MVLKNTWRASFPELAGMSKEVSHLLDRQAKHIAASVQQPSNASREIVLFRRRADETGVMTTARLLALNTSSAEDITETDVHALVIPHDVVDELISISREFRAFVFGAYSKRIADLFLRAEQRDTTATTPPHAHHMTASSRNHVSTAQST